MYFCAAIVCTFILPQTSVGNLKKEKQKKLKKKIDLLITEAKSSKGLDYSFDKLNNYLVDL